MWRKPKVGQNYKDSLGRIWTVREVWDNEVSMKTDDNRLNVVSHKQLDTNFKKI